MSKINKTLQALTLDDLARWAGDTIVNRGKRYVKHVGAVYQAPDGAFAAWVSGTHEYATSVRVAGRRRLEDFCTCPYFDGPCKHAVALVLAAAQRADAGEVFPPLDEDEDLALALDGDATAVETWRDDDGLRGGTASPGSRERAALEMALRNKSRDALVRLLLELAGHYPEVARHIREAEQLAGGRVGEVVRALRAEIRSLADEPAWYDHWRGDGHLPDYSRVAERLQKLLDGGHADAVIELGEELWRLGHAQVEQSDDEGRTGMEVGACMEIVLAALPKSSLAPPEQVLWAIDRMLEDEFSLLHSADGLLKQRAYNRSHWCEVADALEARLEAMPRPRGFMDRYRRERLLNALLDACRRGGRKARIIPLLEAEADACRCYGQLVDALLAAGQTDRARHWCVEGYARTIDEAPGIAADLQARLRRMAEREGRHDLAAAYRAEDFFERPSEERFVELRKAAKKARCWPAVRAAALHYLETGQRPEAGSKAVGGNAWPLPVPAVQPPRSRGRRVAGRFPDLDMQIEIAILEKRPADVVELHGRQRRKRYRSPSTDDAVAGAVVDSHPQVALDIWRERAERLIAEVKPRAYEQAAGFLRRMHSVYTNQGRLTEWQELLDGIRRQHKAKRRLMEVLDNLPGGQRSRTSTRGRKPQRRGR